MLVNFKLFIEVNPHLICAQVKKVIIVALSGKLKK